MESGEGNSAASEVQNLAELEKAMEDVNKRVAEESMDVDTQERSTALEATEEMETDETEQTDAAPTDETRADNLEHDELNADSTAHEDGEETFDAPANDNHSGMPSELTETGSPVAAQVQNEPTVETEPELEKTESETIDDASDAPENAPVFEEQCAEDISTNQASGDLKAAGDDRGNASQEPLDLLDEDVASIDQTEPTTATEGIEDDSLLDEPDSLLDIPVEETEEASNNDADSEAIQEPVAGAPIEQIEDIGIEETEEADLDKYEQEPTTASNSLLGESESEPNALDEETKDVSNKEADGKTIQEDVVGEITEDAIANDSLLRDPEPNALDGGAEELSSKEADAESIQEDIASEATEDSTQENNTTFDGSVTQEPNIDASEESLQVSENSTEFAEPSTKTIADQDQEKQESAMDTEETEQSETLDDGLEKDKGSDPDQEPAIEPSETVENVSDKDTLEQDQAIEPSEIIENVSGKDASPELESTIEQSEGLEDACNKEKAATDDAAINEEPAATGAEHPSVKEQFEEAMDSDSVQVAKDSEESSKEPVEASNATPKEPALDDEEIGVVITESSSPEKSAAEAGAPSDQNTDEPAAEAMDASQIEDTPVITENKDEASNATEEKKEEDVESKKVKTVDTTVIDSKDMKEDVKVVRQESKSPDNVEKGKTKSDKEEKKSKSPQTCIVCRRVGKCKYNIVRNGDIKHLCDDLCFKRFRANPTNFLAKKAADQSNCANCTAALVPGKALLKNEQYYCSVNCSNIAKGKADVVEEDDIEIVGTSTVAPPKQSARQAARSRNTFKCAVCGHMKPTKHEVNFSNEIHRLCSDSCFAAFRYANKLNMSNCDTCSKSIKTENPSLTLQFEGAQKKFCTSGCMNTFKTRKQKIIPCTWCQTKTSNFNMVEKVDGNKTMLFCSLNCLSLYRVNMHATSNQKVTCDHCSKFNPAQYHLTMSDASVRNFCSYTCVMAFQAQFMQPQTPSAGRGTQVTSQPAAGRGAGAGRGGTPVTPTPAAGRGRGRPSRKAAAGKTAPASAQAQNNVPLISQVMSLAEGGSGKSGASASQPTPIAPRTPTASPATVEPAKQQQQPPPPQPVTVSTQVIVHPPQPKTMRNKSLLCKPITQTKATSCRPHAITEGTQTDEKTFRNKSVLCKPILQTKATSCRPHTIHTETQTDMKMYRNKSVLCKPLVQTKATSCRPLTVHSETQTEEDFIARPALVPIPIPIYIPVPMAMYNIPVPAPIPLPLPIPVPCFIPTTRKSADGILKQIKKIRDTVPDDPFEAELLMMAEAVAGDKGESSSSDDDAGDYAPPDEPSPQPAAAAAAVPQAGQQPEAYGEDMLQMALRMAEQMPDEPAMDLESQLQATPVNPSAQLPPAYTSLESTPMAAPEPPRPKTRSKRRSRSSTPRAKKMKVEEQDTPQTEPISIQPQEPPADANMVLKFTYGVNAWKHWVIGKNQVLEKQYAGRNGAKPKLFKTDVLACTPDELNFALCQFVKEVRKPNGEEYAPDSIYYLTLGIQEYLFENGRIDNIFTDIYYERFTECLNEVLSHYEVRLNQQGLIVCRIEEEHLWESKQLGAHSPHVLLNTLVYFNTKFFMLRSVEEHLRLSFSHIMKHWKKTTHHNTKNPGRSVYLRYYAPAQSTEGQRGKRREDQPVFEQAENLDNPLRCPVKLYEFYLSKCPESIKNRNDVFYLVPERSCVPDSPVWYSTINLGADHMSKMLNRLRVVKEIQEAQLHMQPYIGAGY